MFVCMFGRVRLLLPRGFVKETNELLSGLGVFFLSWVHGFVKETNDLLSVLDTFHSLPMEKQCRCLL
jgi:uncharacterized membrane protein required for colicin V production